MKKTLFALLLIPALAFPKPWWLKDSNAKEGDFLQPDQAFKVSARVDGELLRVRWIIADGYYLYRSKFDITAESPGLTLDKLVLPDGLSKTDEYFGTQEIYEHEVEAILGFKRTDAGAHPVQIKVTYQGCAEAGLCYPPIIKVLFPDNAATDAVTPASSPLPGRGAASPLAARAHPARPLAPDSQFLLRLAVLAGVAVFFFAGLARSRRTSATAL